MNAKKYANRITVEELRVFLRLWQDVEAGFEEAWGLLISAHEELIPEKVELTAWWQLYERPIREQIGYVLQHAPASMPEVTPIELRDAALRELAASNNQVGDLPAATNRLQESLTAREIRKEAAENARPVTAATFALGLSLHHSFRCVLYHGRFLNELIARVRLGGKKGDKALFDAIKIDPAVIFCAPVNGRIARATLLKDEEFLEDLKKAILGKQRKREQKNLQMMRLVFEVLQEVGADELSDKDLHRLFIQELDLYSRDSDPKSLRKHAYTYMRKSAT